MTAYTNCPYCDKEVELELENQQRNIDYEETCPFCNNKFIFYFEIDVNIYSRVLDEELTKKIKEMK